MHETTQSSTRQLRITRHEGLRPDCRLASGDGASVVLYHRSAVPLESSSATRLVTRTEDCNLTASRIGATRRGEVKANVFDSLTSTVRLAQVEDHAKQADRDPKGDELCVSWSKPGEILVEDLLSVLTCKLLVRLAHSGERPIESPSSWFQPKFPSG